MGWGGRKTENGMVGVTWGTPGRFEGKGCANPAPPCAPHPFPGQQSKHPRTFPHPRHLRGISLHKEKQIGSSRVSLGEPTCTKLGGQRPAGKQSSKTRALQPHPCSRDPAKHTVLLQTFYMSLHPWLVPPLALTRDLRGDHIPGSGSAQGPLHSKLPLLKHPTNTRLDTLDQTPHSSPQALNLFLEPHFEVGPTKHQLVCWKNNPKPISTG